MIEVALLLGLGAVGYMLATGQPKTERESFTMLPPRDNEEHTDEIQHTQSVAGHNNEVPFFGARVTQSMYSGATEGILDTWTGAGKEYVQKREVKSFFDAKPGTGQPFRQQVETDFEQSRMVSGQNMKNVFPIQQVQVGPGADDGYTNIPKGGFQQDQLHNFMLPKTTDELRIDTKPKLSFELEPVPGKNFITQPGIQAAVNKNKPDKFAVYGMDRANTAVGVQTAPRIYAEQPMKVQARESTSVEYEGGARGNAIFASYIRAFTEPYQEFMKLTTEGRPGPAGGAAGNGFAIGADAYSVQTKRDESVLSDATRINPPIQRINAHADSLGSYRFNEPLPQDSNVARNTPDILTAHQNNPYTHKLTSY